MNAEHSVQSIIGATHRRHAREGAVVAIGSAVCGGMHPSMPRQRASTACLAAGPACAGPAQP